MLSPFSCVQFFATPWTIAHQAPLSMGFSRLEYWSGLPCSYSRDLPEAGTLYWQTSSLPLAPLGKPSIRGSIVNILGFVDQEANGI